MIAKPTRYVPGVLSAALVAVFVTAWIHGPAASASQVAAVRIDGSTITGEFAGTADGAVIIHADGLMGIPIDDLRFIRFNDPSPASTIDQQRTVFYLRDGGHIAGRIVGRQNEAVIADTSLGERHTLPFDALAGIWFGENDPGRRGRQLFEAELADRLVGKDKLLTHRADQFAVLRGNILALGPDGGKFLFNGRERPFRRALVFAVVFATGLETDTSWSLITTLADGSMFSGRLLAADAERITVESSIGPEVSLSLDEVTLLRFASSRVLFVSDLTPVRNDTTGMLHHPVPARFDRSVSNTPLVLDGESFDKGIGVHARTDLDYELDGAYEMFAATIGIDDAVRPRGHVVFKVAGDGRVLFDSGPVTGRDSARDITVNLLGVDKLTLIVEFGQELDLSDHADWADARLIRKPIAESTSQSTGVEQ